MSTEAAPLVDLRRLAVRTVAALALAVDVAVVLTAARSPLSNADTYFHLRFGEEFLHHWSIAHPGQPSAVSSASWVPTQWLSQVAWAWVDDSFGMTGLGVLYAALLTVLLGTAYLSARTVAGPVPAVLAATVAVVGSLHWMGLRPQLISYVALAVTVAAWQRARDGGRTPWWLIPLTWVWAMCHGMWVLGIAIGLVATAGIALERRDRRQSLRHLAVPVGSLVAAALTPVGPGLLGAVFQVGSRSGDFAEWAPIALLSGWGLPVSATVAAVVLLRLWRGHTAAYPLVMLLLAVGFAVYSGRTVVAALLVATPLLARELQGERPRARPQRRELVWLAAGCVVAVLLGSVAAADARPGVAHHLQPFDAALGRLAPATVVLSDRDVGSVLLETHPALDLPVQGYADVFTDAELARYDRLTTLAPGWPETLRRLKARHALLSPDAPLAYALTERGWRVAARAEGLELLVAPAARHGRVRP